MNPLSYNKVVMLDAHFPKRKRSRNSMHIVIVGKLLNTPAVD